METKDILVIVNRTDNNVGDFFGIIEESQESIGFVLNETDGFQPELETIADELANIKESMRAIHRSAETFRGKCK